MNPQTITSNGWTGFLGKGLAPRELQATMLAAADLSQKEIAKVMGITPKSVEKRLDVARFKLGARTMRGLVLEAFKRQIISPMIIALCAILVGQSATSDNPLNRIRRPGERRVELRMTARRVEAYQVA